MSIKPLIIFDSGIGGVSILKELLQSSEKFSLIYLADQKYFPYGNKKPTFIRERIFKLVHWSTKQDPSGIVVACNTATSTGIAEIRKLIQVPVIGVEPVIKPLSKYKLPLLLATNMTVDSQRTKNLLTRFNAHHTILHGSSSLASAIEDMDEESIINILKSIQGELTQPIDAVGLSCTHYPLVKELISDTFKQVKIIDPSQAVVRRIKKLIPSTNLPSHRIDWYTTGSMVRLNQQIAKYLGLSIQSKHLVL